MNKFIVTTTINSPTKATLKFAEIAKNKGWLFVIVGDLKTPHTQYEMLQNEHVIYLHPDKQDKLYTELSDVIGWKTIQRRNIGFVYAYQAGAEIIATVDDDNIPYATWGDNLLIGTYCAVDEYKNRQCNYFDPFSVTNQKHLWHRGFPIEHIDVKNHVDLVGNTEVFCSVQADFWDGDPDIDAICRLTSKPLVKFNRFEPFITKQAAPFNSQNTFLHRSIFPNYSVWPGVGRMDDIWASYNYRVLRAKGHDIVYCPASVYQERNPQDLVKNLENECIGYRHTKTFIDSLADPANAVVPDKVQQFLNIYKNYFN
jgi:hypothetical protein